MDNPAATELRVLLPTRPEDGLDDIAQSAVQAMLLGSNARKVVRSSECPVLVLPADNRVTAQSFLRKARATGSIEAPRRPSRASAQREPRRLSRILVATDLSPASTLAIRKAIAVARENSAVLYVAHPYQPPSLVLEGCVPPETYENWDESIRENVRMRLKPFLDEAAKAGVSAEPLVLTGSPREAIAESAKEIGADLVVVGTHGRTGVPRFFLGSVAAGVVSSAPCPVLTVRGA